MYDETYGYETWIDEDDEEYISLPLEQFRNIVRLAYRTGKQSGVDRAIEIVKENEENEK